MGHPPSSLFIRCQICLATDIKLLSCAICRIPKYCSPTCQKVDWREHKKVCIKNEEKVPSELQEWLDQACTKESGPKDFMIYYAALECLKQGLFQTATQYMEKHTFIDSNRDNFFQEYANKMLVDVTKTNFVLEKGKYLVTVFKVPPEQYLIERSSKILTFVVVALVKNGHIGEACTRAKASPIRYLLLEKIAAQLIIEKKYTEAREIIAKIPDPEKQKDLLRQLPKES